jgi:hypothetical protein
MMTTFDFGDTTLPCGRRDVTTVAPQALTLLNSQFINDRSLALARRVTAASADANGRAAAAWRCALGRSPSDDELRLAFEHVERQERRFATDSSQSDSPEILAWASLSLVLFNSNEFLYID